MKNHHFVTVGVWDRKVPTNPLHLPMALAELGHKVLMIESSLWDKGLTLQPWKWNRLEMSMKHKNLCLLTIRPPLPRKLSWLNNWFNKHASKLAHKAMKQLGFPDDYFAILFAPSEERLLKWLPGIPFIYRPIDDYAAMPGNADTKEYTISIDEKLARSAEAVFPSNPALFRAKKYLNKHVLLIPNAVNFTHFNAAFSAYPDVLNDLPQPIIGFAGALDRYKFDFKLLSSIATLRPDWSFVLIGDVGICDSTSESEIPRLPNIHYIGFRSYEDLPRYIRAFDVGLIPYVHNAYTEGVFPLKLYEYMAVGVPVVSTDLPFLESVGDAVLVANDPDGFVKCIEQALSEDKSIEVHNRIELARNNSWAERAKGLVNYLEKVEAENGKK